MRAPLRMKPLLLVSLLSVGILPLLSNVLVHTVWQRFSDHPVSGSAALAISLTVLCSAAWLAASLLMRRLGADPQALKELLIAIGSGDFATDGTEDTATGLHHDIVAMRTQLRTALQALAIIACDVRQDITAISANDTRLSAHTDSQGTSLEQTAVSTEQLTATVKQNAKNARSANDLADRTRGRAETGGAVAEKAARAMEEISKSSERIADIIGVIDEIAVQTNLLSLNAAVEAARAGEQGRGFAVVSNEVRALAGRSASAAHEIKELIEDSVTKVADGTRLVRESRDELGQIVTSVSELTNLVSQISEAGEEQAAGIEQINLALNEMDSVTQETTSQQDSARLSDVRMLEQVTQLHDLIARFKGLGLAIGTPPEASRLPVPAMPLRRETAPDPGHTDPAWATTRKKAEVLQQMTGDDTRWDEF